MSYFAPNGTNTRLFQMDLSHWGRNLKSLVLYYIFWEDVQYKGRLFELPVCVLVNSLGVTNQALLPLF